MVLPDNSQVWLNAGSTLTYPQTFDRDKRQVKLRGEAFFKVKSDKSKPFIVNTGQYNIKALGTSFNVKAYPEDSYISTTLVEGTININGLGSRRGFSYTLRPNQNLTIPLAKKKNEPITDIKNEPVIRHDDNAALKPRVSMSSVIKTEAMVSWKDRRWTIQGEPLGSLAVLLGRRFNTNIHVSSELLGRYKFSGIIQNETLEQVLQYLRYTTPLKYEIGKGEVWWDIDPDLAKKYSKILNK
jgi:ferric-dicitrate binding protein FerR (iron transport regulator)